MPLAKIPLKKTVSRGRLKSFWTDYLSGRRERKPLEYHQGKPRRKEMIRVSCSTLGTIRSGIFRVSTGSRETVKDQKAKAKKVNAVFAEAKPKTFEFLPAQFLGQKGNTLLERVYRAATLNDLGNEKKALQSEEYRRLGPGFVRNRTSRFWQVFKAKMKRKGVDLQNPEEKIWKDYEALWAELEEISRKIINEKRIRFDFDESNFLLHDYDPETGKFLISIIDI